MDLFLATFLTGMVLVVSGGLLLWNGRPVVALLRGFPRSRRAALAGMSVATVWFLYHVTQLGEADFGAFSRELMLGFGLIAVLSYFYVREFLAVRSFCIVYLLVAAVLLSASWMQEPASRLFMVALVYLGIVLALYLAVVPYRLRDFFDWLFAREVRTRILGGIFFAYGTLLNVIAVTY